MSMSEGPPVRGVRLKHLREEAVAYARELGWAVFPVGPDCRRPLVRGGCHAASADPREVAAMFERPANIALACGARSGVLVLDVDVKGRDGLTTLAELEEAHGWLPPTWESATPSGGRHLFFRAPQRALRNRVGFRPGLDVRTDGGSVALPPSARADGAYGWRTQPGAVPLAEAPPWLLELIDPPEPPAPPLRARPRLGRDERTVRYVCAAIDGECGALASTPGGGRNQRLFTASARLGELVGAGVLGEDHAQAALRRAAGDCGLVKDDGLRAVLATIRSGMVRGCKRPRAVRP